ncbi:MAG TPA: thiamine pyrophosphate-binding protein [Candidatus Binatia bacterium]|jgi:sulfopyruvate decarboxylase subunit alpha|nr:thiamine pyrophosphate-binding protein [Candidatus Binatia bacterium]
MAEDNGPRLIVEGMKEAGVSFVASLPDANLQKLLALVDADPQLTHVTLAREEEGIGICAGAYMGGLTPAVIMQNGGFLNSCNALTTTALNFNIPILLLIYYAGDLGDEGFSMLGSVTEPVLRGLGIRYQVLRRVEEIKAILRGANTLAIDSRRPVAVLLTKDVLGMRK